jgi:pimeloyl-ACP methyl ester carboxylesterase
MLMGWSTGGAAVVACVTKYPGVAKCAFLMSSVPFDGLRMPVVDAKGKLVNPRRWIATWEESLHFGRVTLVAANFQSPDVDLTHRLWSAFAFLPGTAPAQESFEFRELIDSGSKKQRNNDDLRWANITFNGKAMRNYFRSFLIGLVWFRQ